MTTPERARTGLRDGSGNSRRWATPSQGLLDPQGDRGGAQTLVAAQLLTADELAERWQVPKQHVYRLTRDGSIPVVRLGRYFRYRIDAIERWEEEQTNA